MAHDKERLYPIRKVVFLTAEMIERIREYRFANRLASENEAVRQLITAALNDSQSSASLAAGHRAKTLSKLHDLLAEATRAVEGDDHHGGG